MVLEGTTHITDFPYSECCCPGGQGASMDDNAGGDIGVFIKNFYACVGKFGMATRMALDKYDHNVLPPILR